MRAVPTSYELPHPAKLALLAGGMLVLTLALTGAAAADTASKPGDISDARKAELVHFVRHDCGSCHGLTLAGGLGPALNPAAVAGRSAAHLKLVILQGHNGTAMPGWAPLVSEAEAQWIAEQLKRGLPDAR